MKKTFGNISIRNGWVRRAIPLALPLLLLVALEELGWVEPLRTHHSILQTPVNSLDPLQAIDTNAQLIVNNAFDGLVSWNPTTGVLPAIAEKWDISPDGLTYDFRIRHSIRFQNGDPAGSSDVCHALQRLLSTPSYFQGHYGVIKSISCPTDKIVRIQLRIRYPDLFLLLSGVGAKVVKVSPEGKIVGIGPFRPSLHPDRVVLERSDAYWGRQPPTPRFEFHVLSESAAISAAVRGEVHDTALIPLSGTEIRPEDGVWHIQPMWATWIIGLDQRVAPLGDIEVRKELVARLRAQDFVATLYPDQEPATGLIPFGVPGFVDSPTRFEFGPEAGRKSKVEVEVFVPDMLVQSKKIAAWIEGAFKNSWLIVRAVPKSFAWLIENYAKGTMGAYLLSINSEYPDPSFVVRALQSRSSSNFLGIRSEVLDQKISELEAAADRSTRVRISSEINSLLLASHASVNLMHVRHRVWVKKCASGLETSPVSEGYTSYRNVVNRCN